MPIFSDCKIRRWQRVLEYDSCSLYAHFFFIHTMFQLRNRKKVSEVLKPQLRELSIGKHVTRKLQSAPIDDRYLTYLQELNRKISTMATNAASDADATPKPASRAVEDARRQVAELQIVVVKRLRQHLLSNLAGVKSLEQVCFGLNRLSLNVYI